MSSIAVSVDVNGGDYGISSVMEAVSATLNNLDLPFSLYLCGNENDISNKITKMRLESFKDSGRIFVINAPEKIETNTSISRVWRNFPNSSLVKSVSLQKEGIVDATISAGDTGTLFTTSTFILGLQEGITRPALSATLPTPFGTPALLLDVGANLTCKSKHLLDFAKLGSDFISNVLNKKPKVALLNIGSEEYKGTELVKETHKLLKESSLNYVGFIEGNRILSGDADVIVCDGFTGNALLKLSEGMFRFIHTSLEDVMVDEIKNKLKILNADLYGAVPFLGLNGSVFKAHGGSSVQALTQAITTTIKTVLCGISA